MIVNRRGKNVAIWGLMVTIAVAAATLATWLATGSLSGLMVLWTTGPLAVVWVAVIILFYCRQLERQEAQELQAPAAGGGATATIFDGADAGQARPAAARLASMERWVVPIFTIFAGLCLAVIGAVMLPRLLGRPAIEVGREGVGMLLVGFAGFAAFLFSWYCIGLGTMPQWRLLRAGGSLLLTVVLFLAAALVAIFLSMQEIDSVDWVVAIVIAAVQIVLGAEMLLGQVMDFYRPHVAGQERRYCFDSRLCGLLAEPRKVGHSIAETLNYQFGFEVSKTWFYRLLAKALIPMLIFAAVVLIAMTSIVIMPDGYKGVVLRWGTPKAQQPLLGPGAHLKWPWPVETVRMFDMAQVHSIYLGLKGGQPDIQGPEDVDQTSGKRMRLWTKPHKHWNREERDFLLAARSQRASPQGGKGPDQLAPVDVFRLVTLVQYKIADPYKYGFRYADVQQVIENVAERETARYCATATLTSPAELPDQPEAILTYGKAKAAEQLQKRIQNELTRQATDVGVEITAVTFVAVHPVSEAAESFEKIVKASHEEAAMRFAAQAWAYQALSRVAGSPADALARALKIRKHEELSDIAGRSGDLGARLAHLDGLIFKVSDDIAAMDKEIAGEALLGQVEPYKLTLRDSYRAYLALLGSIRKSVSGEGPTVDLAGAVAAAGKEADKAMGEVSGEVAASLARARTTRWEVEMSERSRLAAFYKELPAYQASPRMFMMDRWQDMLDRTLPGMLKYVIAVDPKRLEIRLNSDQQSDVTSRLRDAQPDSNKP
ncbi:MAG: hypothetical protein LLG01_04675 [Planctomycetaceae bacterium]|nr:hypothetical protein [Planctomycetaceae bacterium]